eukprot:363516-Chlamydomonas_euryale.AAC.7
MRIEQRLEATPAAEVGVDRGRSPRGIHLGQGAGCRRWRSQRWPAGRGATGGIWVPVGGGARAGHLPQGSEWGAGRRSTYELRYDAASVARSVRSTAAVFRSTAAAFTHVLNGHSKSCTNKKKKSHPYQHARKHRYGAARTAHVQPWRQTSILHHRRAAPRLRAAAHDMSAGMTRAAPHAWPS